MNETPAPKVITIANAKGGIGKSTTTIGLAGAFAASGERVALLDADTAQGSLSRVWLSARRTWRTAADDAITAFPLDLQNPTAHWDAITAHRATRVLLDMPPKWEESYDAAVAGTHAVVIPCIPSDTFAVAATIATLARIRAALNASGGASKCQPLLVFVPPAPRPTHDHRAFRDAVTLAAQKYCIPVSGVAVPFVGVARASVLARGAAFAEVPNPLRAPFRDLADNINSLLA